jgi:monovalent cation/hydrogen antiporter
METLVLHDLTLPTLGRLLRITDDGSAERQDAKARIRAAEADLERLEDWWTTVPCIRRRRSACAA